MFRTLKQSVPRGETKCSAWRNKLFPQLKQTVCPAETDSMPCRNEPFAHTLKTTCNLKDNYLVILYKYIMFVGQNKNKKIGK